MLMCGAMLMGVASMIGVTACERAPTAPSPTAGVPRDEDGRRTSIPGKAMDRAEDLEKEIADYNKQIEDAANQGTKRSPPKDAPASNPKPPQSR